MTRLSYLSIVNYDELFRTDPDAHIVPCGEEFVVSCESSKPTKALEELFMDGSKDLNFIASCDCGALTGNYYEGLTCRTCGTVVRTNFAAELKFRAWLHIPPMVDDPNDPTYIPPLLHPAIASILNAWLGEFDRSKILTALLDPAVTLPARVIQAGVGQGYKYFYMNFDNIMRYFLEEFPKTKLGSNSKAQHVKMMLETYRDRVFVRYFPILNNSLHVITNSGTMQLGDSSTQFIMAMHNQLNNLIYSHMNRPIKPHHIDQYMCEIFTQAQNYTNSIINDKLVSKKGFIRKCVLGSRLHCSARAVIVPIAGEHASDEVYLPWKMGIGLLKLEILNLLKNRYGYTLKAALDKYYRATTAYDQDIDEIMQTLIRECRELTEVYVEHLGTTVHPKGLPMLIGRNPTLRVGSIMLYYATKVKTDVDDDTLSISSRMARAPNFDFDGDAMHVLAIKEMDQLKELIKLHTSIVMVGGRSPGLSGDVAITRQETLGLMTWLSDKDQHKDAL